MEKLLTLKDFVNHVAENLVMSLMGFALATVEIIKCVAKIVEFMAVVAIAVFMYFIAIDVHTLVALQQHKAKVSVQSNTGIQVSPKNLKLYVPLR